MFGMFTPKASTHKRQTLDDLDEGFQQTLLQLNSVDNPPDDMEHASLTKALTYYITKMKECAKKLEALQIQAQLMATTPSVGTTTSANTTNTMNTTANAVTSTVTNSSATASASALSTAPATAFSPTNIPNDTIECTYNNLPPFSSYSALYATCLLKH